MISRAEIKTRAKAAFMRNYWLCVGIFAILSGTGGSAAAGYMSVFYPIFSVVFIAAIIFVGGPFTVSHARASLNAYDGKRLSFADIIWCFREGRYWKCVGSMALPTLFTALPSIVIIPFAGTVSPFIARALDQAYGLHAAGYVAVIVGTILLGALIALIPTIIIGLSLSQTAYLVADGELSGMAAVRRSRELMSGHRWELFVFGLSFLGWSILAALSEGVSGIFWSGPYMSISYAGYYRELSGGTAAAV